MAVTTQDPVDVLAVGAHPDDADLGVGGMLLKLNGAGHRSVILDLTRGELSSRGPVEGRAKEAAEASRRLGVRARYHAGLPDGGLANNPEQRKAVVSFIRKYRPKLLLAPHMPDRHPDHVAAHQLVRDANFMAGLNKIDTGQDPYRAPTILYYHAYFEPAMTPTFVVDISDVIEKKLEALKAFESQFYNPNHDGPETYVSSKAFWDGITTRAAYWGARVGVSHGEPLFADGPVGCSLPPGLRSGGGIV